MKDAQRLVGGAAETCALETALFRKCLSETLHVFPRTVFARIFVVKVSADDGDIQVPVTEHATVVLPWAALGGDGGRETRHLDAECPDAPKQSSTQCDPCIHPGPGLVAHMLAELPDEVARIVRRLFGRMDRQPQRQQPCGFLSLCWRRLVVEELVQHLGAVEGVLKDALPGVEARAQIAGPGPRLGRAEDFMNAVEMRIQPDALTLAIFAQILKPPARHLAGAADLGRPSGSRRPDLGGHDKHRDNHKKPPHAPRTAEGIGWDSLLPRSRYDSSLWSTG